MFVFSTSQVKHPRSRNKKNTHTQAYLPKGLEVMTEKYQLENPNSHYLANLNNLNLTNNHVQLGRLPTLGEILSNKTKSPINLSNYYLYMQYVERNSDYLDFWFDLVNHLNLCKHYVKGLRESIVRNSTHSMGGNGFASNNPFGPTSPTDNKRDLLPLSDRSKHRSLSLSMLLDLIINDHILEDNDSNRLSEFLRGDINLNTVDPKLKELIENINSDELTQPSPIIDSAPYSPYQEKRISSNSKLMEDITFDLSQQSYPSAVQSPNLQTQFPGQPGNRRSSLNPSLVEKLIKQNSHTNSFISRQTLKDSSHNLLLKYFVQDSEKNLNVPPQLNLFIINAIEVDGRDDPDVFTGVKRFVFNKLENDYLPNFLNFVAIKNVNKTINARMIVGFIFLFFSFWIGFALIFLNEPKRYRCVVILTFFVSFYCLVSAIYRVDPILAAIHRTESFIPNKTFCRVDDKFISRLLMKRAAWVLFLVILLTAVFCIIFCLVPGHRL